MKIDHTNISSAFEKVKPFLTEELIQRVSVKLAEDPNRREVTVHGFGLHYLKDAENMGRILQRRIRTKVAKNETIQRTIEEKHEFLTKALRNGAQTSLWSGYSIIDEKQSSLLVNLATGEVFCGRMD